MQIRKMHLESIHAFYTLNFFLNTLFNSNV